MFPRAKLTATRRQLTIVRALTDEFELCLLRAEGAHSATAQLMEALKLLSCCGLDLAATMAEQRADIPVPTEAGAE